MTNTASTVKTSQPKKTGKNAAPGSDLKHEAWSAYQNARRAVMDDNYRSAVMYFDQALAVQSDFTEAYYNKGAALGNMAINSMSIGFEGRAMEQFRAAVAAKKEAQNLIDQGIWYVYLAPVEQEQVKSDLQNALVDADEVLVDEESLKQALRLWTFAQR